MSFTKPRCSFKILNTPKSYQSFKKKKKQRTSLLSNSPKKSQNKNHLSFLKKVKKFQNKKLKSITLSSKTIQRLLTKVLILFKNKPLQCLHLLLQLLKQNILKRLKQLQFAKIKELKCFTKVTQSIAKLI
jgi:hypothetical protein